MLVDGRSHQEILGKRTCLTIFLVYFLSMIRFHVAIALILFDISLISTFPTGSLLSNSVEERTDSCGLFDSDPSCLSNNDYSISNGGEEAGSELFPDSQFDLVGSSGQISLMDDLSTPLSDTNLGAAGYLSPDFSQSEVDEFGSTDQPNFLFNDFPEEPITDLAQSTVMYGPDYPSLPVIYSYICPEFGEACQQFKDGARTGVIRYAKCSPKGTRCRLCDSSGQECDPDAGWDKQAIPSPDNPNGQAWNHCRNKQCGACEHAAAFVGFLQLGVIPGCGPPKFD